MGKIKKVGKFVAATSGAYTIQNATVLIAEIAAIQSHGSDWDQL